MRPDVGVGIGRGIVQIDGEHAALRAANPTAADNARTDHETRPKAAPSDQLRGKIVLPDDIFFRRSPVTGFGGWARV